MLKSQTLLRQTLSATIDLHVRIDLHISSRLKMALKSLRAHVRDSVRATISRADFKRMTATTAIMVQMTERRTVKEAVSRRIIPISRADVRADFTIKRISSRALPRIPLRLSL
jgi:hypothetical protein